MLQAASQTSIWFKTQQKSSMSKMSVLLHSLVKAASKAHFSFSYNAQKFWEKQYMKETKNSRNFWLLLKSNSKYLNALAVQSLHQKKKSLLTTALQLTNPTDQRLKLKLPYLAAERHENLPGTAPLFCLPPFAKNILNNLWKTTRKTSCFNLSLPLFSKAHVC